MNLLVGRIIAIESNEDGRMATVSVKGAIARVPLMLIPDATIGDTVLIESGVAIAKVTSQTKKDEQDVSRNSG